MIRNRFGFTLVEALITLGIIGVIAGLAIPQAIAGRMAQQAKSQFDTAYAILQHAIADMAADGVELHQGQMIGVKQSSTTTTGTYANTLYSKFKPYLKISVDCGADENANQKICPSPKFENNRYENYTADSCSEDGCNNVLNDIIKNGGFVLQNGMMVAFSGDDKTMELFVTIDINGKSKLPNKWGYDVFTFQVLDGELVPVGAQGTKLYVSDESNESSNYGVEPEKFCDNNIGDNDHNGATCAYFALNDEEYFKKLYGRR